MRRLDSVIKLLIRKEALALGANVRSPSRNGQKNRLPFRRSDPRHWARDDERRLVSPGL